MELLFASFFTTASASTSLVLLLLQHPAAIAKIKQELKVQGLEPACSCVIGPTGGAAGLQSDWDCGCELDLSLTVLGRLHYVDCVVKEVLRLLPPVSGGYRTALCTFELDVSVQATHPGPPELAPCNIQVFLSHFQASTLPAAKMGQTLLHCFASRLGPPGEPIRTPPHT